MMSYFTNEDDKHAWLRSYSFTYIISSIAWSRAPHCNGSPRHSRYSLAPKAAVAIEITLSAFWCALYLADMDT